MKRIKYEPNGLFRKFANLEWSLVIKNFNCSSEIPEHEEDDKDN